MASRNPVLIRATGETLGQGQTTQTTSAPAGFGTSALMTMDDVIVKTGILFVVLVAGAFFGWNTAEANPSVLVIGAIIGLGLGLVNSFKRNVSPALVLAYGVAEGVFLGGISKIFDNAYAEQAPQIVSQAVIGTLTTFGVMLALYRTNVIKVNGKFMKIFSIAMVSYLVIALASFVSSFFHVGNGWGFYGVGQIGLLLCAAGVALAAFSLVMDFELIAQGVCSGLPEKESWRMAFGLTVTLVWLYTEILRLLAILNER
jgi:uncharacterized YccA/Bax inhibitor family protein